MQMLHQGVTSSADLSMDELINRCFSAVRAHEVQELTRYVKILNGELRGVTSAHHIPTAAVDLIRESFNSQAAVNHVDSSHAVLQCASLLVSYVKDAMASPSLSIDYIGKMADFSKFLMRFHVKTLYYFIKSGNQAKMCFVLKLFQGIAALGEGFAIELLQRIDWKKMVRSKCFKDCRMLDRENGMVDSNSLTLKGTPREEFVSFVLLLLHWDSRDILGLIQANVILFRLLFAGLPIDADVQLQNALPKLEKSLFRGNCWLHLSLQERRRLVQTSHLQHLVTIMHRNENAYDILTLVFTSIDRGLFSPQLGDAGSYRSTIEDITKYTLAVSRKLKCHQRFKHMQWILMVVEEAPLVSLGFLINARVPQSFAAGSEWNTQLSITSKMISQSRRSLDLLVKPLIGQQKLDEAQRRVIVDLCLKSAFPFSLSKSVIIASLQSDNLVALYHTLQLVQEIQYQCLTVNGSFRGHSAFQELFLEGIRSKVELVIPDMRTFLAIYIHHRSIFQSKDGGSEPGLELVLLKLLRCIRLSFHIQKVLGMTSEYDPFKLISEDISNFSKGHMFELLMFAHDVVASHSKKIELACSWKVLSVIIGIVLKRKDFDDVQEIAQRLLKQILLNSRLFDSYTPEIGIWIQYLYRVQMSYSNVDMQFLVDFFSKAVHHAFSTVTDIVFLVNEVRKTKEVERESYKESEELYGPLVLLGLQQGLSFLKSDKRSASEKETLAHYLCFVIKDLLHLNQTSKLLQYSILYIVNNADLKSHKESEAEYWSIISGLCADIEKMLLPGGTIAFPTFNTFVAVKGHKICSLYKEAELDHLWRCLLQEGNIQSLQMLRDLLADTNSAVSSKQLQIIAKLMNNANVPAANEQISLKGVNVSVLVRALEGVLTNISSSEKRKLFNMFEMKTQRAMKKSMKATTIVYYIWGEFVRFALMCSHDVEDVEGFSALHNVIENTLFVSDIESLCQSQAHCTFLLDSLENILKHSTMNKFWPVWLMKLQKNLLQSLSQFYAAGADITFRERFVEMYLECVDLDDNNLLNGAALHIHKGFVDINFPNIGKSESKMLLHLMERNPCITNHFSRMLSQNSILQMQAIHFVRLVPILKRYLSLSGDADMHSEIAKACIIQVVSYFKSDVDVSLLMILSDFLAFLEQNKSALGLLNVDYCDAFGGSNLLFNRISHSRSSNAVWECKVHAILKSMLCLRGIVDKNAYASLSSEFMRHLHEGALVRKVRGSPSENYIQVLSHSLKIAAFHLMQYPSLNETLEVESLLALLSLCVKFMYKSEVLLVSVVEFSNSLREMCENQSVGNSTVPLVHLSIQVMDLVLSHSSFIDYIVGKKHNKVQKSPNMFLTSILYKWDSVNNCAIKSKAGIYELIENLFVTGMKKEGFLNDAHKHIHTLQSLLLYVYDCGDSAEDDALLRLLEILAGKSSGSHLSDHQFLWGDAYKAYQSMSLEKQRDDSVIKYLVQNIHLPSINAGRVLQTIHWVLGEESMDCARYNPLIMLEFLKVHAEICTLDFEMTIKKGLLSLCIVSLASNSQPLRMLAFEALCSCHNTISSYDFRNSKDFELLIGKIKLCISDTKERLLTPMAALLAELAVCLSIPDGRMYSVAYKLLQRDTTFDVDGIPVFLDLLNSTFLEYRVHQKWLLSFLRLGILEESDFGPFRKRFAFEILMAFAANPLTEHASIVSVFLLLQKASKIARFVEELVFKRNILTWLSNTVLNNPIVQKDKQILDIVLNIIHNILKAAYSQRWTMITFDSTLRSLMSCILHRDTEHTIMALKNVCRIILYQAMLCSNQLSNMAEVQHFMTLVWNTQDKECFELAIMAMGLLNISLHLEEDLLLIVKLTTRLVRGLEKFGKLAESDASSYLGQTRMLAECFIMRLGMMKWRMDPSAFVISQELFLPDVLYLVSCTKQSQPGPCRFSCVLLVARALGVAPFPEFMQESERELCKEMHKMIARAAGTLLTDDLHCCADYFKAMTPPDHESMSMTMMISSSIKRTDMDSLLERSLWS